MSKTFNNIPLSVLDLAPINEGKQASDAFKDSVDLAKHTERWGFNRYWLAEHHNMPGIASSATSVIMGHIASETHTIRIGSGGVMLPNHAPLIIAEQFGTLESLYPGRIDLGLGRAPGTDQATAYALRRTLNQQVEDFPKHIEELEEFFKGSPDARVRSFPGEGLDIPIWLLGSSDYSARLAAQKGLAFSFAGHFAPAYTVPALNLYRKHFIPSDTLLEPYAMVGINVIAADTNESAQWLATSQQQQFLSLMRGEPTQLKPPIKQSDIPWSNRERIALEQTLDPRTTIVGDPLTVKQKLESLLVETNANEIIIHSQIFHHEDRLRSYEILSEMMD